jgi:hypothetical protein
MPQTMWATIVDVETITGVTVDAGELARAAATIDMEAGRTYDDVSRVGSRDAYWLKLAVCYQAAWLQAQPDAFQRLDIDDGNSGTGSSRVASRGLVLGPYAKRALRRVSWLKSRSLHVQAPYTDGTSVLGTDPLSPGSDGLYPWTLVED